MTMKKSVRWAVVEFLAILFVQFFVMKFIIMELGIAALGVWSVLMSAAQIAGFLGMGTAAGAGRFLSIAHSRNNIEDIESILSTIVYGTIPLYALLSVILYFPISYGLTFVLHSDALMQGQALIGWALLSFVAQTISASFASSLTSVHLGYRKSQISIMGMVIQAILSVVLIKRQGLEGLALAQVSNYVFLIILALFSLRKELGLRLGRLLHWNGDHFRVVILFGLKVQATSIAWTGFEMSIRFIMARFGGIGAVGLYEIAYKVASQPRIFMFFIGQNIAPVLAGAWGQDKEAFYAFYKQTYARLVSFGLLTIVGILVASPLVSYIMLGRIEPLFLLFSALTACGTAMHIAAIPSELAAIAIGVLKYNIRGTATAVAAMLLCGTVFGFFFQDIGVAVAVLISSCLAATTPIYFGHRAFALPLLPRFRSDLDLRNLFRNLLNSKRN
ncbi:MAG: MATE family efflux transporter [Alphaproteobacteria bacterium]|nr:MATE family efflux transporter [Alphaproteobacteria bacterium]